MQENKTEKRERCVDIFSFYFNFGNQYPDECQVFARFSKSGAVSPHV